MKEVFPEYYVNKKNIDFHNLDDSILVVLDTNVLLDFYRGSKKLRGELTKSLNMIKDNIWMPYQVGFEFNRNRKLIIHGLATEKKSFTDSLQAKLYKLIKESTESFSGKNILFKEMIEENKVEIDKINEVIEGSLNTISKNFNHMEAEEQLPFIEEIFSGKIANNDQYSYSEWENEGQKRYNINRPPGYKDLKEKKDDYYFIKGERVCAAYGDFFLWKELMLKAKDEKIKEVVFITKDVKEDWFYETKGMKIGARVELIEEMLRESEANFRIYTSSSFLSKTSAEKDYKMIEKEVIKSEKPAFLTDLSLDKKYEYFSDKKHFKDFIFSDEENHNTNDVERIYSHIYDVMNKIDTLKYEIEENLHLLKKQPYHSETDYYKYRLEKDFHEIIGDYNYLQDKVRHSFELLKNPQTNEAMKMVYSNLLNISIKVYRFLQES